VQIGCTPQILMGWGWQVKVDFQLFDNSSVTEKTQNSGLIERGLPPKLRPGLSNIAGHNRMYGQMPGSIAEPYGLAMGFESRSWDGTSA